MQTRCPNCLIHNLCISCMENKVWFLFSECQHGSYGQGCAQKCYSNCNGCNNVNGSCDKGCKPGWKGENCYQRNCTYQTLLFNWNCYQYSKDMSITFECIILSNIGIFFILKMLHLHTYWLLRVFLWILWVKLYTDMWREMHRM